ncbi:hypothetical protein D3C77_801910 [compost metagenome]
MHGVRGDFVWVEVEDFRENLEGKTGRKAVHSFVDTRCVTVLLDRLGLGVGVLEVFAVVDAHFRINIRVFRFFQP